MFHESNNVAEPLQNCTTSVSSAGPRPVGESSLLLDAKGCYRRYIDRSRAARTRRWTSLRRCSLPAISRSPEYLSYLILNFFFFSFIVRDDAPRTGVLKHRAVEQETSRRLYEAIRRSSILLVDRESRSPTETAVLCIWPVNARARYSQIENHFPLTRRLRVERAIL